MSSNPLSLQKLASPAACAVAVRNHLNEFDCEIILKIVNQAFNAIFTRNAIEEQKKVLANRILKLGTSESEAHFTANSNKVALALMMKMLQQMGKEEDAWLFGKNDNPFAYLNPNASVIEHYACTLPRVAEMGRIDLVRSILNHLNVEAMKDEEKTFLARGLYQASLHSNTEIVELLLAEPFVNHIPDQDIAASFDAAVYYADKETMMLFLTNPLVDRITDVALVKARQSVEELDKLFPSDLHREKLEAIKCVLNDRPKAPAYVGIDD